MRTPGRGRGAEPWGTWAEGRRKVRRAGLGCAVGAGGKPAGVAALARVAAGGSRATATHGRARHCEPLVQLAGALPATAGGGVPGTSLQSKDAELGRQPQALICVELKRLNYQILKSGLILN